MTAARILVTGAAGFLGSAVTSRLLARPDVDLVVGVDVQPIAARDPRLVACRRDVAAGIGDLLQLHRIDAVVHHAFLIQPQRRVAVAERANVAATALLTREAEAAGVTRIVYPSSTTVYGAWPNAAPHREDESPRPLPGFAYSEHKVAAEGLLRAAQESGGPGVVILRGCIVAGPGARGFVLDSLSLPVLPVVTGHDPEMQFIHIDDYCDAVEAALDTRATGTFNIAGTGTVRVREMVQLVGGHVLPIPGAALRTVVDWSWKLRLQGRSPASGLDLIVHPWLAATEEAAGVLGWAPLRTSRQAIEAWADWRRSRREKSTP